MKNSSKHNTIITSSAFFNVDINNSVHNAQLLGDMEV